MKGLVPKGVDFEVRDGEIHHWWGAILLRDVKLPDLLRFLQDYNHHAGKFADVERSRLISVDGTRYRIFFRFRRSKAFVTAVYNTEQEAVYTGHGPGRVSSYSVATRIAEVDDPGTPSEREKLPGNDRGFLWRLVSWWRFEQRGNDVAVELESASLSRDIPGVVRMIPGVSSYIRSTPRESLESVLASIRRHVKSRKFVEFVAKSSPWSPLKISFQPPIFTLYSPNEGCLGRRKPIFILCGEPLGS
jgi:hypothetical protein